MHELDDITRAIIDSAMKIHKELGPGLLWCDTYGIVTEQARLIRLIEIVAETLQRLRDLRLIEG